MGADRIILKDGTIESSDRVWESERYVHFILQGTHSVEIRYAKEIVARIEGPDGFPIRRIKPPAKSDEPDQSPTPPSVSPSTQETLQSGKEREKSQRPHVKDHDIDRSVIKTNQGVKFFDPRRPQKYWVARNSRHDSLSAALDALSNVYNKPPIWIETHMGEENDLGLIHANLIAAYDKAHETPEHGNHDEPEANGSLPVVADVPVAVEQKGHSNEVDLDPVSSDKALKENDRDQPAIRKTAVANETGASGEVANITVQVPAPAGNQANAAYLEIPKGISFYDPRRSEKYWVDEVHRFNSLDDALRQLSALYGVSQEWIGDHLGNSNELREIHRSIRESLTSE